MSTTWPSRLAESNRWLFSSMALKWGIVSPTWMPFVATY